jgi:spore coat protein U-like protein
MDWALLRAAAALSLCAAGTAWGQVPPAAAPFDRTAQSIFTVTAKVFQRCTITTTPINFGSYDPVVVNLAAPRDENGTVSLTCTKGSDNITITLSDGQNAPLGGQRRLAGGGDFLNYELYKPSASVPTTCDYAARWGSTNTVTDAYTAIATWKADEPKSFFVCGRIPGGQNPTGSAVGVPYTDTITATVYF